MTLQHAIGVVDDVECYSDEQVTAAALLIFRSHDATGLADARVSAAKALVALAKKELAKAGITVDETRH